MDTWYSFGPELQDRLVNAAYAYLLQAQSFTPTLAEFHQWRAGLSPGWQRIQPDEKLQETWDSLPILAEYLVEPPPPDAPPMPENWLRGALPNMFNMTFSLHQFVLESRNYSVHEFMMLHLSEDDYLAWQKVRWPTSLL